MWEIQQGYRVFCIFFFKKNPRIKKTNSTSIENLDDIFLTTFGKAVYVNTKNMSWNNFFSIQVLGHLRYILGSDRFISKLFFQKHLNFSKDFKNNNVGEIKNNNLENNL